MRPGSVGPEVRLRPLEVADAAAMADVLAHPSLYEHIGGEPPTVADLHRRYAVQVRGASPDGSQRWLNEIVLLGGRPIGYVQATIPRDGTPTEIAWVIGRPWQGSGRATAAARLLLAELAHQGVHQVIAHIHPANVASIRVAMHLGLVETDVVVDGETRWAGATTPAPAG